MGPKIYALIVRASRRAEARRLSCASCRGPLPNGQSVDPYRRARSEECARNFGCPPWPRERGTPPTILPNGGGRRWMGGFGRHSVGQQ